MLAASGEVDAVISPSIEAIVLRGRRDAGHSYVTPAIELLAYIAAVQGDLDKSARLAGYTEASLAGIGYSRDYVPLAVHGRLTAHLHDHLAPGELARLMADGASLASEAAIPSRSRLTPGHWQHDRLDAACVRLAKDFAFP